jgi:hypothetical protein
VDSQLPSLHLYFALSKPIYHKAILQLFVNFDTKQYSYWLELLLWCDEDWGYFYDLCQVVDIFPFLEKNPNLGEMKPARGLPITKFASTLCLKPTYISQGNITAVFYMVTKVTHID